ncbi:MAG: TIGR01777 family protein [SAR324 cluster bacterium]|uniref:TIGR01777 family protein n=1 Tax=SAR324 cluster bacterium TaxID=2024889 RepID=A0A7X9FRD9_9DELT|nr:TIGR01777 family protein [SAR324 cluster bacterium]
MGQRILIAGASGLIGTALSRELEIQQNQVFKLSRSLENSAPNSFYWEPKRQLIDLDDARPFDCLINLSGSNIGKKRWTNREKELIWNSRIQSALFLCKNINRLLKPSGTFINASAIGFYGNRGEEVLDEESSPGEGFLAKLSQAWESSLSIAVNSGFRVLMTRFGIVLSEKGGALANMLPLFYLGLGGPLGSGTQYMSWISLDDICKAIIHCLNTHSLQGAINVVAPNLVTNAEFARTLGKFIHRPVFLKVPSFILKIIFSEMAEETILTSTRAYPKKLLESSFSFEHPTLEDAFRQIFS